MSLHNIITTYKLYTRWTPCPSMILSGVLVGSSEWGPLSPWFLEQRPNIFGEWDSSIETTISIPKNQHRIFGDRENSQDINRYIWITNKHGLDRDPLTTITCIFFMSRYWHLFKWKHHSKRANEAHPHRTIVEASIFNFS